MKLASYSKVPPGSFTYRHPISGLEMVRHAWELLRADVTAHCEANGYPFIPDVDIERQICERLGPVTADRFCEGEGVTVRGVDLNWRDVLHGTKVLSSFLLAGSPLVEKSEAERRASICARCPRNVNFNKPCGGLCGEIADVVSAIVGQESTHFDSRLEACAICRCSLRSKIWFPMDLLEKHDTEENQAAYPDFCWQKRNA